MRLGVGVNIAITVRLQCDYSAINDYSANNVRLQCGYSAFTVRIQCEYSAVTVRIQCEYSAVTVRIQCEELPLRPPSAAGKASHSVRSPERSEPTVMGLGLTVRLQCNRSAVCAWVAAIPHPGRGTLAVWYAAMIFKTPSFSDAFRVPRPVPIEVGVGVNSALQCGWGWGHQEGSSCTTEPAVWPPGQRQGGLQSPWALPSSHGTSSAEREHPVYI
jgi:hypothetical protein